MSNKRNSRIQQQKEEVDLKQKKNEKIRILSDIEIQLKFLESKLTFQQQTDEEELQILNEKIREYKETIKILTKQIKELKEKSNNEQFKILVQNEKDLNEEIDKLKKEKEEKEFNKKEKKKALNDCHKKFEQFENERIRLSEDIQKQTQTIGGLENLKNALEAKKN